MALSIDTSSSAISTGATVTGFSSTYTLGGTVDGLMVGIAFGNTVSTSAVSSVFWNGIALTAVANSARVATDGAGSFLHTRLYGLIAPATGTNTLSTQMTAAVKTLCPGFVAFIGSDQATLFGTCTTSTGTGANGSCTGIGSAVGDICIAVLCTLSSGAANHSFADNTERWERDEQVIIGSGMNGATKAGAASVTMTAVNEAGAWAISAVTVKAAAAGGAVNRVRFPAQTSAIGVGGMLGGSRMEKIMEVVESFTNPNGDIGEVYGRI